MANKLFRTRSKIIAGVCGGIAKRMGWDDTIVRLIAAISFLTGFGLLFLVYIVLWMITPYEDDEKVALDVLNS